MDLDWARRRSSWAYLRAFTMALRDRGTYDPRANVGLWMGFGFALPIPILLLSSAQPLWIYVAALAAPPGWAVVLGATRRIYLFEEEAIHHLSFQAVTERDDRRTETAGLRAEMKLERGERERLELLQRTADADLALARTIHATLVPPGIQRDDLVVAVRNVPCNHVGGDYLHASLVRPGVLYLCVGDVSGHGVSAALVVSRLHAFVQSLVLADVHPDRFLEALHHETYRLVQDTTYFMTFAVFRVDLEAQTIEYGTAGHPAQFLLRVGGTIESLATRNGALGMESTGMRPVPVAGTVPYRPGDTLVLFTDGIFEVVDRSGGELLGEEGLASVVGPLGGRAPEAIVADLLRKVDEYRLPGPFQDDVCLLVARLGSAHGASAS